MVIYGDILFIVNMTVDYLLIGLTAVILKREVQLLRQISASVFGGISAFYIFIETNSFLLDVLYRIILSVVLTLIAFGFQSIRKLVRAIFVNLFLSFLLCGIADLTVSLFKNQAVVVNNTVVYIGISPVLLIISSVVFYFIIKMIFNLKKNGFAGEICSVSLVLGDSEAVFRGLVDSGNSISDAMSDSEILIVSDTVIKTLCGCRIDEYFESADNKPRCRVIPVATVGGRALLKGVRCDKAFLSGNGISQELAKPIIAEALEKFNDEYEIIVPMGALKGR